MPDVGYTRNEGTFRTFLDFSKVMERIGAAEKAAEQGDGTAAAPHTVRRRERE